jgi:hypothetical protein
MKKRSTGNQCSKAKYFQWSLETKPAHMATLGLINSDSVKSSRLWNYGD